MTDKELSLTIKEIGLAHGMCNEYSTKWREDYTQEELIGLFISGQDFCIEHNFPPCHLIRECFDMDIVHSHNIFLGEDVSRETDESGTYILLEDTQMELDIYGFAVVEIYVRHKSRLRLNVRENAIVKVSLYDEGTVEGTQQGIHSIKVYDRRKKKEGD